MNFEDIIYTKLAPDDSRCVYYAKYSYVVRYSRIGVEMENQEYLTVTTDEELGLAEVIESALDALNRKGENGDFYNSSPIDLDSLEITEAFYYEYSKGK